MSHIPPSHTSNNFCEHCEYILGTVSLSFSDKQYLATVRQIDTTASVEACFRILLWCLYFHSDLNAKVNAFIRDAVFTLTVSSSCDFQWKLKLFSQSLETGKNFSSRLFLSPLWWEVTGISLPSNIVFPLDILHAISPGPMQFKCQPRMWGEFMHIFMHVSKGFPPWLFPFYNFFCDLQLL